MGFEPVQTAWNRLNSATELSYATLFGTWPRLPEKLLILNLFSLKRKKCKQRGENALNQRRMPGYSRLRKTSVHLHFQLDLCAENCQTL